ncbi:MAG: metallophosphoesterase [Bacteroidetes bacterium]|nr:metallophosphoesterase [Bacteroidota bacterium]
MKKQILLLVVACITTLGSFAQFSFIHLSDMHVSTTPAANSDTNAQYFQCAIKEFARLNPKPSFVLVTGDISDIGNMQPLGMYPAITQHLFPPSLTNPAAGAYFIDSAKTIPIYFTPGNHEYWTGFDSIHIPISNDTLFYYPHYITPDTDYVIQTASAVIVCMRSGHDSPYGYPPNPELIMGTGLSNAQCSWLRNILRNNSSKRKIIAMHHPPVNAVGTNSDGSPYTASVIADTATNSLQNNRTNFLNICDSNHVDVLLAGHEHQNVVANRKGDTISEIRPNGTRYVQTAAAFNRSFRIITVDPAFVTVSPPMRSCLGTGVDEVNHFSDISVFPNPARDKLTIECHQKATLEILTVEGQIISRIQNAGSKTIIDLVNLQGGVYIIKAKTSQGITIRKFVKQ